ncbi:MAG: hypothetical protein V9G08_05305 [Dermatophilaceae bacterium]
MNGKYDGAHAGAHVAEHRARTKWSMAPAEVRHRQALVDGEALDLVEHRGVGRVEVVGAEHLARARRRRSAVSG